jgi:hypothetical protein
MNGLRAFQDHRLELGDMIRAALHLARGTADDQAEKRARELLARLAADRFQLAVVGQFSRGKTTLMNARRHLPAHGSAADDLGDHDGPFRQPTPRDRAPQGVAPARRGAAARGGRFCRAGEYQACRTAGGLGPGRDSGGDPAAGIRVR